MELEKEVVVLIKGDPEQSHRPVEAVRIALGLLSSEHQVTLVLMDKAALLLGEEAEDLVDGEELGKYLPPLKELGQTFHVEQEALHKAKINGGDYKISPVSIQQIGKLIQQADRHFIF